MKKLLIFLLLFTAVEFSNAQTQSNEEFSIDYIDVRKGLLSNFVTKTISDGDNFKYFATEGGVSKYDGYGFIFLDLLEELGSEENTIVFFLSDNGGPTPDNASSNEPLRGKKGDFFEGGVRIPFAMQWKGVVPEGITYDHPIISLDIFGTVAGLIGVAPKIELDGKNILPFVLGEIKEPPHEALYWRNFDAKRSAVRTPEDKLITQPTHNFLFDIHNDLGEKNDLTSAQPEKTMLLTKKINEWKSKLKDPQFMGLMEDAAYSKLHPDRYQKKQN